MSRTGYPENVRGGSYEDPELDELYTALTGRAPFRYDAGADPLYRSAVSEARHSGALAMRDAMGQAASLTGGYGSSYAQAVGQQQYDAYLRSLAQQLPQYYSAAWERYQAEGKALREAYDLARDRRDREAVRQRQAEADERSAEQSRYARQKDSYQRLYKLIAATGYTPTEEELAEAGMSREQAQALQDAYVLSHPGR
ncbi:MAG: hypothetical protein IK095_00815 [Oscillospiraceae bacterium]|nr:hypothetical protein [Oscillospiraceae bacterium]